MNSLPDTPISDLSLMDLFRIEAENCSRLLEADLLKAEAAPTPERLERLMRAAHSIKGAARIVGLDAGVLLAHAMEDVLSAAQRGSLQLKSESIELLLRGNDVFKGLAASAPVSIPAQLEQNMATIQEISTDLRAQLVREPELAPSTPARPQLTPSARGSAPAIVKAEDGFIRVQTTSFNRMLGLAGESLVQSKSISVLAPAWLRLKAYLQDMRAVLKNLVGSSSPSGAATADSDQHLKVLLKQAEQLHASLTAQGQQLESRSRRMEYLAAQLYDEVIASRMRPFIAGVHGLPRMVRDLAKQQGKEINFQIIGEATGVDRDVMEMLEAPLIHLLRNAVDHGLELPAERIQAGKAAMGNIVMEARHSNGMLQVSVQDDGRGIDPETIRRRVIEKGYASQSIAADLSLTELFDFLFLPGFSTSAQVTELSGRGVGLDIVRDMASRIGGLVHLESQAGVGSKFFLQLPLTLTILRALLVTISGEYYALPLARIERLLQLSLTDLQLRDNRQFVLLDNEPIDIVPAAVVLLLANKEKLPDQLAVIIIGDHRKRYGLLVDRFIAQRELVVLPLAERLGKIPNVSAGTIMEDGVPALILDIDDMIQSIDKLLANSRPALLPFAKQKQTRLRKRVLIADDSLTIREMEHKLLLSHGYEVALAVDGVDAWNILQTDKIDLVISDLDMPRMGGIELIRRIKTSHLARLPIMIISYKDRPEDRLAALDAGADHYLTKSDFQAEPVLDIIHDLIGEA